MVYEKYEVRVKFNNWFTASLAYNTLNFSRWAWNWVLDKYGYELLNLYQDGNDVVFILATKVDPIPVIAVVVAILGIAAIFGWTIIEVKKLETQQEIAKVTQENLQEIIQDPNIPLELKQQALNYIAQMPTQIYQQSFINQIFQISIIFIIFMLILKLVEKA